MSTITNSIYYEAAYLGHLLSEATQSFSYYVPCTTQDEPFRFVVDDSDIPALVKTIHYLQGAFFDKSGANFEFNDNASQFYLDACDEKVECATMGLIYTASRMLVKDDEETDRPKETD